MSESQTPPALLPLRRVDHVPSSTSVSADLRRAQPDDSWVEIASQPSSSSLSSVNDEHINLDLPARHARRRQIRRIAHAQSNVSHPSSMPADETSSQEEYEESESESDRVMTSSGEGAFHSTARLLSSHAPPPDDDDRTAINDPIRRRVDTCFTPQPNAFSHPPSAGGPARFNSAPGSYFPPTAPTSRPNARHSLSYDAARPSHFPQNILSPSYNAAAHHEEALRTSLSTLLSCAAAARGLPKPETAKHGQSGPLPPRTNRVDTRYLRLVSASELPDTSPTQFQEPTFAPTIRRTTSASTSASSQDKESKRKSHGRGSSRERRQKKARRSSSLSSSMDEVTPTLLTWVVSASVVVIISALSFSAGYSMAKEAARLEILDVVNGGEADEAIRHCAREATRSTGMGFKRTLAQSAVQA